MKKMISLICVSAMILTFTACGGSASSSSSSETGSTPESSVSEQSESSAEADNSKAENAERPPVTKEGILTRKAGYYSVEGTDTLGYEEIYDNDGKILKRTLDDVYGAIWKLPIPVSAGVTEYEYDSNGNLIKETWTGINEMSIKEYDETGLLIGIKHKYNEQSEYDEDKTYSYEKDESGNHVKVYYLNNLVYGDAPSDFYDARNLQYELEYSDGVKTKRTQYARFAGKTEDTVYTVEEYDSMGRVTHFTQYDEDGNVRSEYSEEFDSDGKLTKHNYIVENGETMNAALEYVYDAEGSCINRLINGEEEGAPLKYKYEYDENGNVIKGTLVKSDGSESNTYIVYEYCYKD